MRLLVREKHAKWTLSIRGAEKFELFMDDPINSPDLTNTDQRYWEKVLRSHNLSMRRGDSPQKWIDRGLPTERKERVTVLVGGMKNLEGIEHQRFRQDTGRVKPGGFGPDKEGSEGRN